MARYEIDIDDALVEGITAALAQHNAGKDPADQLADEAAYVQHVMASAAKSWGQIKSVQLAEKVRAMSPKNVAAIKATIEARAAIDVSEKAAEAAAHKAGRDRVSGAAAWRALLGLPPLKSDYDVDAEKDFVGLNKVVGVVLTSHKKHGTGRKGR